METQKILKPDNKVVILADFREKKVIENLRGMGAKINEMNLAVGDFVCSHKGIAVERKTHSDFVSSVIDGRIFNQLKLLKENYQTPVVIIEGFSNRTLNENALKAAIASIITNYNASLVHTNNEYDTAKMIFWLAKKEQQEKGLDVGFKHGKKPRDIRRSQEYVIASLPGISKTLAERLLKRFGSLEGVVNAKEDDIAAVKGVGRKLAAKIKSLLTAKY